MTSIWSSAAGLAMALSGAAAAQDRITIHSDWGEVEAVLSDTAAGRALADMLPLTLEMTDHLRQEKTVSLPAALPELERQRDFRPGMLGLWGRDHFVIYYRDGRVPPPGIIVLGEVTGDVSIFDRPGPVTIRLSPGE